MRLRQLAKKLIVNSSRIHLARYNRLFAESIPAGALVLDAGAGDAPYRQMFSHAKYETADFKMVDKPYASMSYVCDLAAIPVESERFRYILLN